MSDPKNDLIVTLFALRYYTYFEQAKQHEQATILNKTIVKEISVLNIIEVDETLK
jgi:hypothetical protein